MARVYWFMSHDDLKRYFTLGNQIAQAQQEGDALRVEELQDQFLRIPGRPNSNPDHDTIIPVPVIDRQRVIVEVNR